MILMVGLIKPGVPSPSSVFWVFFFWQTAVKGEKKPNRAGWHEES